MKEKGERIERSEVGNIKFLVNYFYENKYTVHISLFTGIWKNGSIIKVEKDHFIIDEFKEGETPVLFSAVRDISKYKFDKLT